MGGLTFEIRAKFVDDAFEELCQELLPGFEERHMEAGGVMLRRKRTVAFFSYRDFQEHALKCELARLAEEQEAREKEAAAQLLAPTKKEFVEKAWEEIRRVPHFFRDFYSRKLGSKARFETAMAA